MLADTLIIGEEEKLVFLDRSALRDVGVVVGADLVECLDSAVGEEL